MTHTEANAAWRDGYRMNMRIAGDVIGPGDFEPTGLYAVHTDDEPGDNAGAPMQETMVCGYCLPTWGGEAIYLAEDADDRPEHLVLTEVRTYVGGFDVSNCNYCNGWGCW